MTDSVPGLGWPEDAIPPAGEDQPGIHAPMDADAVDADADAWLAEVARSREYTGVTDYRVVGRTGGLPERYARRASRMGLGWPGDVAGSALETGSPVDTGSPVGTASP